MRPPRLTLAPLHFCLFVLITVEVMSQSGKVLHLYVEVRSAPDQNRGKAAFEESEEGIAQAGLVQDGPAELLSQLASQTTCQTVTRASAARCPVQDCTHSQSPSRNTVSFQLQQTGSSPTVSKQWSAPCDEARAACSPPRTSGKVAFPHASPGCRRFGKEEVSDGKRSVVTFSYIEKSSVKTVDSPRRAACEDRSTRSHFHKRLSDPVWFGSPDSSCSSSPKLTFRSPGSHQQTFSPIFRQPPLDPIGRAATQRAVEEFGSPLLRIKLAHALENSSFPRYPQQPRCQSWAGSPVQRQNISINLKDHITERSPAPCGLPRSPASDQLSSQPRQSPHLKAPSQSPLLCSRRDRTPAGSPATKRHAHRTSPKETALQLGNNIIEGLNQLSDSKSSSPAHSPEVARRLAEEATKVSSVFTEARRNSLGECASGSKSEDAQQSKGTLKMNIPLNDNMQHAPAADNTERHQPENALKTRCHHQDGCSQAAQHQTSLFSSPRTSPAVPSRILRPSHPPTELSSPMRDPRLFQAELRAPDTPTLHRRQLPQYTRDCWSPGLDKRRDLNCFERGDCTELARRLYINQSVEEAPVSWTSRQQWGTQVENSPRPNPEPGFGSINDHTPERPSSRRRRPLSPTAQQKRAEQRRREILLLGPVVLDSAEEDEGCDEEEQGNELEELRTGQQPCPQRVDEPPEVERNGAMGGSSSRSSSGVTGSLGDRDCVSPESSQSSHHSTETGVATSGIQVGVGQKPTELQTTPDRYTHLT